MKIERPFGITSHGLIKIDALKHGLNVNDVSDYDSDPGINLQPFGMREIMMGANNRLKTSRANGATGLIFAIENGIVEIAYEEFVDLGIVIAEDEYGNRGWAKTREVKIPLEIIYKLKEEGFDKTTWGMVLAKTYPEAQIDHQDPHSFLTKGEESREKLLIEAILLALQDLHVSQCRVGDFE